MDYTFYTDIYGGTLLSREQFLRLKGRAQRYVSGLLRPEARRGWCDAARFAACAAAEALHQQERRLADGDIRSETVGRHSVTYADRQAAERMYTAAARWLEPEGLLYRGLE